MDDPSQVRPGADPLAPPPGELRLVTRPVPYRTRLPLALAEAAAVVVWALDSQAEPTDETWLYLDPDSRRLEVGVPIGSDSIALPEGLLEHRVRLAPGTRVSVDLQSLREQVDGARYVRIVHDEGDGSPQFGTLHATLESTA